MDKVELRSRQWFSKTGKDGFIYRAWMKNQGIPAHELQGKPVIGICNTWSELTPCNAHFRELAESIKHGIYEAGGFPVEFPVMSLGENADQANCNAVPQPGEHGCGRIYQGEPP